MNINIPKILQQGEGVSIEFKRATGKLPESLFETICVLLNHNGGTILLGVTDCGVDPDKAPMLCKDIANLSNNLHIIQLFIQIGRCEELGTGVRNVYKYTKFYSDEDNIEFEERDVFIAQVPLGDIFADRKIDVPEDVPDVNEKATDQVLDNTIKDPNDTVREQVNTQVSDTVSKLLEIINIDVLSPSDMIVKMGLKHRTFFLTNYIQPALRIGLIEMTIPDIPNSRLQKYGLTPKGKEFKEKLYHKI